jgi:hypothetical protein
MHGESLDVPVATRTTRDEEPGHARVSTVGRTSDRHTKVAERHHPLASGRCRRAHVVEHRLVEVPAVDERETIDLDEVGECRAWRRLVRCRAHAP